MSKYESYEVLEKIIVNLFEAKLLTKQILDIILNQFKYKKMETKNNPIVLENGITFDYILMFYYNYELFLELKKKAKIEDDFYNKNFEDIFYDFDWIYDFQKNTMLWREV